MQSTESAQNNVMISIAQKNIRNGTWLDEVRICLFTWENVISITVCNFIH